jgi:protein SCO1/2
VRLVSFTVDPEHDTPAVLKEYGQGRGAQPGRWYFVTGSKQQMFDVAAGMKLTAKPAEGDDAILHSPKFLLIDAEGRVRGIYNGTDEQEVKQLAADAATLANAGGNTR